MREILAEILDLQPHWTSIKNDAMARRGELVRHAGPDWLRQFSADLANAIGIPIEDLGLEGRDGTGPKTEVPWFRFYSKERSPSATIGWYCVYLFDTDGHRAFLTLGHGSTDWTGVDFKPRPHAELAALADWAREKVSHRVGSRADMVSTITLNSRRSNLGPSYEAGTVCALVYEREAIPTTGQLRDDALFMATLLHEVYGAEASEPLPGAAAPEIVELYEATEKAAGKARRGGQGFRLTAEQRRAVELRAMELAKAHLIGLGWPNVKDVSGRESFDLHCSSDDGELFVEVKGTTSDGESIILTKNEVAFHRDTWPRNALIVVTAIILDHSGERPSARGGSLSMVSPWEIEDDRLAPISFLYSMVE